MFYSKSTFPSAFLREISFTNCKTKSQLLTPFTEEPISSSEEEYFNNRYSIVLTDVLNLRMGEWHWRPLSVNCNINSI